MSISLREAQAMIDRACGHADDIGVPIEDLIKQVQQDAWTRRA